jgi:hypothetical protein
MADITPEIRAVLRAGLLTPATKNMVFHLGFYLMWFGVAEMMVTQGLGALLAFTDHEKFDLLIRGMDLRVKIERLYTASKAYNRPLGPNLKKRLTIITEKQIPLRNRLSHSWPYCSDDAGVIHLASIGAMPPGILKDMSFHPSQRVPPSVHPDELFDRGLWLQAFTGDMIAAISSGVNGGPFEVSVPNSDSQWEGRQVTLIATPLATPDRPPQTPPA